MPSYGVEVADCSECGRERWCILIGAGDTYACKKCLEEALRRLGDRHYVEGD